MDRQIFQASNPNRWIRFRWTLRIILFLVLILISAAAIMLFIDKAPTFPFRQNYKSIVSASKPFWQETKLSKEYKGFRDVINDKKMHTNYEKEKQERLARSTMPSADTGSIRRAANWTSMKAGIRSAFYVAWDPQSYFSLRRNIHALNLVIPEWFFIDPNADTVRTVIDAQGYNLMKNSGVPIMPILSNNFNRQFRPEAIGRILADPRKRQAVISFVLRQCLQNHFIGINIDLEELNQQDDQLLVQFVKEISESFHRNGLLVTEDIMPFNEDYNVKKLGKYNDYIFLMAYDEYSSDGTAGPIGSQRWIEAAVDEIVRKMPQEKVILGLGAFGYDWPVKDSTDPSVTYQQALSRASASHAKIEFNNDTYNLSFNYADDSNVVHHVYFTDAATQFNSMRFGAEYGLAGFAVWRLGSEDGRLWKFFNHDMSKQAISGFNFKDFEHIGNSFDVDYVGDGEILNVLNTPHPGKINVEIDTADFVISEQDYQTLPSNYEVQKYGVANPKTLVLTFDDGPDETFTPRILDVLAANHVSAAFFVVGLQAEKNLPILKRIYREGHEIGNHTFTHRNIAKISEERAGIELKLTRILIESITGHSTILFRAPYNADSEPSTMEEIIPVALARKQNYLDIGENIDPEDWEVGVTAQTIVSRVLDGVKEQKGNIILLHDAGGASREATVKALPVIIQTLKKQGYTFTSLAALLGKKREELMPKIAAGSGYYVMQFNMALATLVYWLSNFFYSLFIIFIMLGLLRLSLMVFWAIKQRKKERNARSNRDTQPANTLQPLVSIIVPAYNEEVNAVSSLKNLLNQQYPNYDILFVDDGSKDSTYIRVSEAFGKNAKIKIFTKPNGGKASALNYGLMKTNADYVVCIDADTQLYPDALCKLISHFLTPGSSTNIGAVAGNVKVGNLVNMLTRWQDIEYITSQNFDRMAYAAINAITVVPGAIGAFKKEAIDAAGGFTTDTLAEDCDLTVRILRAGYIIENENQAVAITEAPEKVGQLMKQRSRWSFGVMQTFWKHRDTLFNKKYKGLGLWAMPNMLVFQFLIPLFSPLADLFLLFGIFTGNAAKTAIYYAVFLAVDISISVVAFLFERERLSKLLWIIPQRFVYRWMMYVVLFRSFLKAIKGELQTWGVLKRTGNVKEVMQPQ